ncbi:uncharacterized protein LOC117108543 [Anneissia japonica]|uniref:uncharacterized protein LOC117108543 n=1 Tax=Anneissia japonica TaxID=1529436 RepID=UPI0014257765|nr:uncharacterized protein LOC117108543 [Anneissia japonica]
MESRYYFIALWFIGGMNTISASPTPLGPCDPISAKTGCSQCSERGPCLDDTFPFEPGYFNSTNVTITCRVGGHCISGSVPIDPWLTFALKTQREIQIDEPLEMLQLFDAHNAFNSRADGYADYDTCQWPPPYDPLCVGVANQEFAFTDLLNMGVRGLEIDIWWCYDEMRMAHLNLEYSLVCLPTNRLFRDGLKEIGDWFDVPGNENEILRLYINEKYNQSHDDMVNGPIKNYLGDRVLTPNDLKDEFKGKWPTMRRMRETGKTVVITNSNSDFMHGGIYFHPIYWSDRSVRNFDGYPNCNGRTANTALRFYGDLQIYNNILLSCRPFYNGPRSTGVLFNLTDHVRCGVQFPAGDMINPDFMRTGVYTWDEGEPSIELTQQSCVFISLSTRRWHATNNCEQKLSIACQSTTDQDIWLLGRKSGAFGNKECKTGYTYSIPKNGFQQEKILELLTSQDNEVWIDYSPWLPQDSPGSAAPLATFKSEILKNVVMTIALFIFFF